MLYSDAFAGGFAAGLVQNKPLPEAVRMGKWLASLSIQELGASYVFFISKTMYAMLYVQDVLTTS